MTWVRNFRRHVWHFESSATGRFLCGSGQSKQPGGLAIELPQSYRLCKDCERLYGHWQAGAMAYRGQAMR